MKMFYEKDADVNLIKEKKVANILKHQHLLIKALRSKINYNCNTICSVQFPKT